jgi:hypothetical protein
VHAFYTRFELVIYLTTKSVSIHLKVICIVLVLSLLLRTNDVDKNIDMQHIVERYKQMKGLYENGMFVPKYVKLNMSFFHV